MNYKAVITICGDKSPQAAMYALLDAMDDPAVQAAIAAHGISIATDLENRPKSLNRVIAYATRQ